MTNLVGTSCLHEFRGQEKAWKLIGRAFASNRMPHAFLFRGPDGVGKKLFALKVAAAVNCHDRQGSQGCGVCSSCRKFYSGSHPDFMMIIPEKGAIKIEQVRQMCQALAFPPYESSTRVVLLEDVHGMRMEAANSLLKTLEEPPLDNLLILTADSSKDVLPTIASRCQLIPFYSLKHHDAVEVILQSERGLERETAELLARLAEGSPGRALLYWQNEMMPVMKSLSEMLSDSSFDPDRDAGTLLKAAEMMSNMKENLPRLFGLLRIWIHDILMHGSGLAGRAGWPKDEEAEGYGEVKSWSSERLFGTLKALDAAERQLARNCNRTLVCEVLLFSMCSRDTFSTQMAVS